MTFLAVLCLLAAPVPSSADRPFILLQSTTSTQNSGLLDAILPQFTALSGLEIRVVAVGTGQALRNAQNGDGDVVLVHSRLAEEAFVKAGYGVARQDVMYNDFVIIGPESDPAGIAGAATPFDALKRIAEKRALFVSRGAESGTHQAELRLWAETGEMPSGPWYREVGAGMGTTINITVGMAAYTLTDRATWTAFGNQSDLRILYENHPSLFNPYGVIVVNPERHPHVKVEAAQDFVDWLVGPGGQAAIAGYRVDGQQVFFPNADAQSGS